MRLLVLTTQTPHHVHFAQAVAGLVDDCLVVSETDAHSAPYPTGHPFEAERDAFERAAWFEGEDRQLDQVAETRVFGSCNDPDAVAAMKAYAPDLAVSFGVGLLRQAPIHALGDRLLNLHGGDPEQYRGLDTHLWAIWHRDFASLSTCLHRVSPELDAGAIVATLPLDISQGMPLKALRKSNTETCVALTRLAVDQMRANGHVIARAQREIGRYYSFMPAELKSVCLTRFERHTDAL